MGANGNHAAGPDLPGATSPSALPTTPRRLGPDSGVQTFRVKMLAAMVILAFALTVFGFYLAERSVRAETQHDLRLAFASEVSLRRTMRDIRHASLAEHCRALVRKPRIKAALEDEALDLLYVSAEGELGELAEANDPAAADPTTPLSIRPRFYRFLDQHGAVIPPETTRASGALAPHEEKRLALPAVPLAQENGYLYRESGEFVELIATPVVLGLKGERIAALVAGFSAAVNERPPSGFLSGLYLDGKLRMPSLAEPVRGILDAKVAEILQRGEGEGSKGAPIVVDGAEQMLFVERLNPDSTFAPAYEVGAFPLTQLLARQSELRWKAAIAGALLLGLGIAASFYISARLATPVRELAAVSAENRVLRERAETALEIKINELERSVRFSADASHQLKTPVTVLRSGLDEVLAREDLAPEMREELAVLVHQTFRLTTVIEDLLLLSRLDSGRLQLLLAPLNLGSILETCVEDLELSRPDAPPTVQVAIPAPTHIAGDKRYTMLIVENLLENAAKYGTPGQPIRVTARRENGMVALSVANRGQPIPPSSQEHIFERFHRAAVGENIPGHGLGLNLAWELTRLHGGDLRLVRSDETGTEFEARFREMPIIKETLI